MQFTIHPGIYNTDPRSKGLLHLLELAWIRDRTPGDGTMYIISGFANYNGGVRFYDTIKAHIRKGGKCVAFFGGSTSQRLSSLQVVQQLLEIGCEVHIINRKRILHAKCYGLSSSKGDVLINTSGNFTGPGMSQNIEASVYLDETSTRAMRFSWRQVADSFLDQRWEIYSPSLSDLKSKTHPACQLLYDEVSGVVRLDDDQEVTLLMTLGHHDTARIQADPGETAGLGSQYFWMSKDSYDFFPALTIRNQRGYKATYSALINMHYRDLGLTDPKCRVTFEMENNVDFRLGTGRLRYTKIAEEGDLAAITRISEYDYELRIIKKGSALFKRLSPFAVNFIGGRDKRYGYIPNADFLKITQK